MKNMYKLTKLVKIRMCSISVQCNSQIKHCISMSKMVQLDYILKIKRLGPASKSRYPNTTSLKTTTFTFSFQLLAAAKFQCLIRFITWGFMTWTIFMIVKSRILQMIRGNSMEKRKMFWDKKLLLVIANTPAILTIANWFIIISCILR